jgi:hypothetical protein
MSILTKKGVLLEMMSGDDGFPHLPKFRKLKKWGFHKKKIHSLFSFFSFFPFLLSHQISLLFQLFSFSLRLQCLFLFNSLFIAVFQRIFAVAFL